LTLIHDGALAFSPCLKQIADTAGNQSINQNLLITCAALSTKLESEARAVTSGRVLRIVIEKVGLEVSFESMAVTLCVLLSHDGIADAWNMVSVASDFVCGRVCLCVCVSVKTVCAISTKLGSHLLYGSGSASIDPEVKRSKVKVTRIQK